MVATKEEEGTVKSIFYINAVVGEKKFAGQVEISGSAGEDGTYAAAVSEFFNEVHAEPVEGQIVSIEPRIIGGPPGVAAAAVSNGATPAPTPTGPPPPPSGLNCPVHNTPFQQRTGKFGYFESCGQKNEDGSWCKMKPNK